MKKFEPLRFKLIEEGRLARALDDEINKAAKAILEHAKLWPKDTKAKSQVVLTVTFSPESVDDGSYAVESTITGKRPARPKHASLAIHDTDQETSEDTLFVRASGSDAVTPRQLKLATDDGRAIDQDTGKAIPPKEKK